MDRDAPIASFGWPFADHRAANGRRLTPQERQNVDWRQNSVSRQIYRDKHNPAIAPN